MAKALEALADRRGNSNRDRPKVRVPDLFSGADPAVLEQYLTQTALYMGRYVDGFTWDSDSHLRTLLPFW